MFIGTRKWHYKKYIPRAPFSSHTPTQAIHHKGYPTARKETKPNTCSYNPTILSIVKFSLISQAFANTCNFLKNSQAVSHSSIISCTAKLLHMYVQIHVLLTQIHVLLIHTLHLVAGIWHRYYCTCIVLL